MKLGDHALTERGLEQAFAKIRRQAQDLQNRLEPQLPNWIVFGPKAPEHPGQYAVRLWVMLPEPKPFDVVFRTDTLEAVHRILPSNVSRIERGPDDDENIVEVWI